jgi:hypothetical protein
METVKILVMCSNQADHMFSFLQGAQAWYIPSTICGAAVLIAGLLVLMLPETKDKELCDTVEEIMEQSSRDKVSLRNCWPF